MQVVRFSRASLVSFTTEMLLRSCSEASSTSPTPTPPSLRPGVKVNPVTFKSRRGGARINAHRSTADERASLQHAHKQNYFHGFLANEKLLFQVLTGTTDECWSRHQVRLAFPGFKCASEFSPISGAL